jgi:hypothetical protein
MAKKEVKQSAVKPVVQPALAPQQPSVSFDAWWAMVQKQMPRQHSKEVVLADFKARGMRMQEPVSAYNNALTLYGVKLK